MAWINSRTRSRRPASIGSNQLSKRSTAVSVWGCERSGCVLMIVMAWSPVRRFNAGRFEVEHPGDYATFNSYQPRYGTRGPDLRHSRVRPQTLRAHWLAVFYPCVLGIFARHDPSSAEGLQSL